MQATTPRGAFRKLYSTNQTTASLTAPSPTLTAPAAPDSNQAGFFNMGSTGDEGVFNFCLLVFYGTGNADTTGNALIVGWRKAVDPAGSGVALWIPVKLLFVNLTLSSKTGVATGVVLNTEKFVDTITTATEFTSAFEVLNPGDNTVAMLKVDPCGCDFLQVLTGTGSSSTDLNVLAAGY